MENLKNFIEVIEKAELKTNSGGTQLNQIQRNKYKQSLIEALQKDIDIETFRVEEGIGINIYNETFGVIPIVIDVRFKNLDFDLTHEADVWTQKQIAKKEKAQKALRNKKLKAERDAKSRALKQQKQSERAEKGAKILREKEEGESEDVQN